MPYVITTKRPTGSTWPNGAPSVVDVSRRAVATLDEAREATATLVAPAVRELGDLNFWTSADQAYQDATMLPESGGTVGPLPDGTVIEVEAVTAARLLMEPGVSERYSPGAEDDSAAVAAFNAAREVSA